VLHFDINLLPLSIDACTIGYHPFQQKNHSQIVSLDYVVKTMKATGDDMKEHFKVTFQGSLAVNIDDEFY
jgi:hypothetical protein